MGPICESHPVCISYSFLFSLFFSAKDYSFLPSFQDNARLVFGASDRPHMLFYLVGKLEIIEEGHLW